MKQKLLVSIRGPKEALNAYKGGAHIIDVEYPTSALGTPYPLNIKAVRNAIPKRIEIATNIGEEQRERKSTACQASLGVALAGADIIKAGLAGYSYKEAEYLGGSIVRTVQYWFPWKKVIPAVFADRELRRKFDPIEEGPKLGKAIGADGVLIDTFFKKNGKRLLDLIDISEIAHFVKACHKNKIEAWLAGSITENQLPELWHTGANVICIRGAACISTASEGRFGKVSCQLVKRLITTIKIKQ